MYSCHAELDYFYFLIKEGTGNNTLERGFILALQRTVCKRLQNVVLHVGVCILSVLARESKSV